MNAFNHRANDNIGVWVKANHYYLSDGYATYRFNNAAQVYDFLYQERIDSLALFGPLPARKLQWHVYNRQGVEICVTSNFNYWHSLGYILRPVLKEV